MTSTRVISPVVTVPVLSSTTVSMRRVSSRTSGPLMRMPSWAPRPVPTSSAVGVARPSAQGQAMTSTATATSRACPRSSPVHEPPAGEGEHREDEDDRHEHRRDPVGQALDVAFVGLRRSTRRAMPASVVSDPTRVASTASRPVVLTLPPVTSSPGADVDREGLAGHEARRRRRSCRRRRGRPSRPSRQAARRTGPRRRARRRGSAPRSWPASAGRPARRRRPWRRGQQPRRASRVRSVARASSQRPMSRNVVTTVAISN